MRVYRDSYKAADGKRRLAAKWTVEFKDHTETVRRIVAFTDKRASEALGRQIERLVALRLAGEQPDAELRRWLEQLAPKLRTKLARLGLLDPHSVAAMKPLRDHLDDCRQALLDKGDGTKHVANTVQRISAILTAIRANYVSELDAAAVARYLAGRRADGISARTSNAYLTAIKGFCRWLGLSAVSASRLWRTCRRGTSKLTGAGSGEHLSRRIWCG